MTVLHPISLTSTTLLGEVAQGRDPAAERSFVVRYGAMVRALALSRGLSSEDVEDITQEVLLAAIQNLRDNRYDRERGRFKTFLRGIIRHKITDAGRRAAGLAPIPIDPANADAIRNPLVTAERAVAGPAIRNLPDPHPSPAEAFEADFEEQWQKVAFEDALDEVRLEVEPVTFQAFDLYARKGRPPGEVARLLGVKKSAVYTAKSRILDRIREKLQ